MISNLTWVALLGLPAHAVASLLFSILSARKDLVRPFRSVAVLFVLYVPAAWVGYQYLGLLGLMVAGVALRWTVALSYIWILRRFHGLDLLGNGMVWDLLRVTLAAVAGLAPFALLISRDQGALAGTGIAMAAGLTSLCVVLALRYRILPRGLRTFFSKSETQP